VAIFGSAPWWVHGSPKIGIRRTARSSIRAYADEVRPVLVRAAAMALAIAAHELHISGPKLIWLTRGFVDDRRRRPVLPSRAA